MASIHRNEITRKKQRFEEKTSWEHINDPAKDRASHKIRALIATTIVFLISLFYLDHIYTIQITDHNLYVTKADDNRIRVRPIEPIRGKILDRNGKVLAESYDTFDIIAKKENIASSESFISNASKVFKLNQDDKTDLVINLKIKNLKRLP